MFGILVFIPVYRCKQQIGRVLRQLEPFLAHFAEVLVVDNKSADGTLEVAESALRSLTGIKATLIENDENYQFGGSNKIAFRYLLQTNYNQLLILHGDDQAAVEDIMPVLPQAAETDSMLGARFHPDSKLIGYSTFRMLGNRGLDLITSLVTGRKIFDTGSGLNLYSRRLLSGLDFSAYPDDLTFSTCLLLDGLRKGYRFRFFPLTWREEDQISNAKVIRQGLRILGMLWRYLLRRHYLVPPAAARDYTYRVVFESK